MKKLLIVSAGFLFVAGFISIAWAHGPNGGGLGYRSHGYSQPYFNRSFPRSVRGHHQHHGHSYYGSLPYSKRNHVPRGSISRQSRRLPRIENGVILSKPGPIQSKQNISPLTKAYDRGIGVSPLRKALERKGVQQVPQPLHTPHAHHGNHSDPWFYYGKGKQLRQLGILPPLP